MRAWSAALWALSCAALAAGSSHRLYSGYSVYSVELNGRQDQELVHELELQLEVDVWQHGAPGRSDALLMVAPRHEHALQLALQSAGLPHRRRLSDVASAFAEYDEQLARWRSQRSGRLVFEDYPRHDEVNEYLEAVAARHPDLVTLVNAGPSYEGRDVKYLKISTSNFTDASKPVYFLDAMIHAREWVTTPVALYAVHRLVDELLDQDRDLLDQLDWIIMPVVNPDGYEYSHTDARLWRRTRSVNLDVSTTCVGVDGNRNFDFWFNTIGVSSDPCSDVYPGTEPFSEPETGYVRDILHEHLDRIQIYVDLHSHGSYVLFGYGNGTLVPNAVAAHHVGAALGAAIDAVRQPFADTYLVGNGGIALYPTSGSADDYASDIGVPFSYTLELPNFGFDFRVPPEHIDTINRETWAGLAASARLAALHYRARTT